MSIDEAQRANLVDESSLAEEMSHWHIDEAAWKADQIVRMLSRNHLAPQKVGEIGSGSGDILASLQEKLGPQCTFRGYDISTHAINHSKPKENARLQFVQADVRDESDASFDLMLVMDVLEHIENYFEFLRGIRPSAEYKIFQVALNISAQTVLRKHGLANIRLIYKMRNLFTRETLLQVLKDSGYEIIDRFYTTPCTDLPTHVFKKKLMKIPRKIAFGLNQDLAVRLLGGYRLLVLAK